MNGEEHWMKRQLTQVAEEAKNWPQWRHEEARRRFGSDSTELEPRADPPTQDSEETNAALPLPDTG